MSEAKFVCECNKKFHSACKGLGFYQEVDGKKYCVLHCPTLHKKEEFDFVLERKLNAFDFDFQGVYFPSDVNFKSFPFISDAIFAGARFVGDADFSDATFTQGAYFSSATFTGQADFRATNFNGKTYFHATNFQGEMNEFYKATFSDVAFFDQVNFSGEVFFHASIFQDDAYFDQARFNKKAGFSEVSFNKRANYSLAIFSESANFTYAKFYGETHFTDAQFGSEANFSLARFCGLVEFPCAKFNSTVYFNHARLETELRFVGSAHNIIFAEMASLDLQRVQFSKPEQILFHSVKLRPHWFINVDSRKFEFTNIDWGKTTVIDDLKALESVENRHHLLSIAYRQLATNYEENNRYDKAADFRYASMNALRLEYKWKKASWWLDGAYWLVSGYSERIQRAFMWLLGLLLVFSFLYTQVGFENKAASEVTPIVQEMMPTSPPPKELPLPAFRDGLTYALSAALFQRPEPKAYTFWAKTCVSLEMIFVPLQAALLALAIRRRFMR